MEKKSVFMLAVIVSVLFAGNAAAIWVDPNNFDVNTVEGTTLTETLTIGNDSNEVLNFTLRSRETSHEIPAGPSAGSTGSTAGTMAGMAEEKKIILQYKFSEPVVSSRAGYDWVQIEGLEQHLQTGAPIVPVQPVKVLIPFGKTVINSRVIALDTRELPRTYHLPPAQKPHHLSYQGTVEAAKPDPAIYGRAAPWPGINHKHVATQSKRGYWLFTVNLYPVQYTPSTGKLTYTAKLRLEIDLADAIRPNIVKPSKKTISSLRKRISNPNALMTYPAQKTSPQESASSVALLSGGPYEYVIITNNSLMAAPGPWNFQALRDAKTAQGITATIVTTEWIYANYDGTRPDGGTDNQTRIRNFLIDAYHDWDTEYVLLGGTNAIVPARMFWVDSYVGDIDTMPADMYYGCVDPAACTFNYDADGRYGEPTDGVGGGDVDLYAEIYVGRATVENATELRNFIKKTLAYDSTQSQYLPRISMLGEYLGFGGVTEYAKDSMEQIRLGGDYDGYFTYGFENHIQPDFYDFNTTGCLPDNPSCCWPLYDKDYDWPKSDLIDLMNGGIHIFNHLGHADYAYCMKLNTSNLSSLINTEYFFAYSQGCMPGGFDTSNCFAEVITSMEHGAFAAVMNARYGWGTSNSTDGPSQRFARQFWDAALGEDMLELGRANQDSKEDNYWDINGECIRWCYYELNLFGDPQQRFRFEEVCKWLTFEPQEGTIEPAGVMDVNVTFDAMMLPPGTYNGDIIIDSNDPCSPTVIPATMTVNPDDLVVTPAEDFDSNGTKGGPFEPECMTYTLTNNGTEPVDWTAAWTENWLSVTPYEGTLDPNESIEVDVCIDPNANLFDPNTYTDTVIFQNLISTSIKSRSVTLSVKPPDCFTESFDSGSDLELLSVTFIPDGSIAYCEACREKINEFPTDPNGGTYIPLSDDDFEEVILNEGKEILFYGQWYDRFYIGSNGYITFGQGDFEYMASLEEHFSLPRISGLFTDLAPETSQNISCNQLDDRVVVTFQDVPLYGDKDATNSFQVEMFFADGAICISWLDIAATEAVAGLSEGEGLPEFFVQSDLSEYPPCWPLGDFDRDYFVNFVDFAVLAMHWLDEGCSIPFWCGRTDLDFSSTVDIADVGIFAENWLAKEDWWLQPISHWKFDEGEGDTAYDSAANNHGTIYGATWTTGQINGALSFDGANDYVDVGDKDILDFGASSSFSIAAWVNSNIDTPVDTIIVDKRRVDDGGYHHEGYSFKIYVDTLYFGIEDTSENSTSTAGDTPIRDNRWHHVAAVRDTAQDKLYLYLDGVLDATPAVDTTTGTLATSRSFKIGHSQYYPNFFDGLIDDVRIYGRALSDEEIWQLYYEGMGEKASNPYPADGAANVDPNVVLSWAPGKNALSHDIYLGLDYNDVNNATQDSNEYMGNFDVNSYDPNSLELETTYYWRIDERNISGTVKGDIWGFRTWLEPNFISWWKFDEGEGDIAYDSTGNNHGTIYGATWTTGQIDDALAFDGDGDYVEVANDQSQQITTNQITLSAWIKLDADVGDTQRRIIHKQEAPGIAWGFEIFGDGYNGSSGNQLVFHDSDGGAAWYNCLSPTDLNPSQWYHVAVTDNAGVIEIYIDGQPNRSCDDAYRIPSSIVAPIIIGATNPATDFFFDGTIDDVRIYGRALSDEEIWQLYQQGL